jgi:hypothetical protein
MEVCLTTIRRPDVLTELTAIRSTGVERVPGMAELQFGILMCLGGSEYEQAAWRPVGT